jgi:hypothetical protein
MTTGIDYLASTQHDPNQIFCHGAVIDKKELDRPLNIRCRKSYGVVVDFP